MKKLFENWNRFLNEELSGGETVREYYEQTYPSAALPLSEKKRIRKSILQKFKKIQKEMIKSLSRGRKKKQYVKKFGAKQYKKALPLMLKNIKNSQIVIVLGYDSPGIPDDQRQEFFEMLLNKGRRMAGALVKEIPNGHRIIILADILLKRKTLDTYLQTTFYHEFVGHIVPEAFEKVTGTNVSAAQSAEIMSIIKPECIRMARKQAHVSTKMGGDVGALKEINAWLSAMTSRGMSQSDYDAICKDQARARNVKSFQKTDSFKKYGSGAYCIKCDTENAAQILRTLNNLAKAETSSKSQVA